MSNTKAKYPERYHYPAKKWNKLRLSMGDDLSKRVCFYCGYEEGHGHDYNCRYITQGQPSFF